MVWPITWPANINADALDPNIRKLCEVYATVCMTALTLHRVGGKPVTIMPASRDRIRGHYVWDAPVDDLYPVGSFYPGLVYPSAQDLTDSTTVHKVEAVDLPGPVGAIVEVRIDGVIVDPAKYRVENGRYLILINGGSWPSESGDNFTVTYQNSHPVDEMGAYAAGVLAEEWLKLITTKKNLRLPASATTISRQGLTMEVARGMFPEGVTGIPEVDAYLMLWNPFGLKVAPKVYSPDLPVHRQVWHA